MDINSNNEDNSKIRYCCDCHVRPVKPQRNAKKPFYRCEECHRTYKREEMRRIRARKKEELQDDPVHGMKRCTKCKKLKYYSAYSARKNSVAGELNKVCDACLSKLYLNQKKYDEDMTPEWWRARAYAVNSTYRARAAKKAGVPTSSMPLENLPWICKPNDLIELFIQQDQKCMYCGVELTKENLGVDHKTSLGNNGEHALHNIGLCCKDCNLIKLARNSEEFIEFLQNYAKRIINRYNL